MASEHTSGVPSITHSAPCGRYSIISQVVCFYTSNCQFGEFISIGQTRTAMYPDILTAAQIGFAVTFVCAIALIATQNFHGRLTLDYTGGVQKVHKNPTSRIGGLAIAIGFAAVLFIVENDIWELWALIGLSGLPVLIFGLGEDITGKVGVRARLLSSFAAGLIFCFASGYTITRIDIPGIDYLMTFSVVSLAFSVIAIGGVTNAVNMIDGFHGLASGTVILILAAIAIVAARVGDETLVGLAIIMAAVVAGFFLVNFPFGKIFLGDAGAYFCGYVVAVLAVMLPARNPEVSPWVSLLILGYPVTETLVSIARRIREKGHHPGAPDSAHLHHVIFQSWARLVAKKLNWVSANPLASVFSWGLPIFTLISVQGIDLQTPESIMQLGMTVSIYIVVYRLLLPLVPNSTYPPGSTQTQLR